MTFREYFTRYEPESFETFEENWYLAPAGLDRLVPEYYVEANWELRDGPMARAYNLLGSLDLGPGLAGLDSVGALEFIQGPVPGSNYTAVCAADNVSLSLLQKRLNDLGTGIRVVTGYSI